VTTKEQLSAAITNKYGLDRKMSKKYAAIIDAGRITDQEPRSHL
jgi:hypothetical protein